jgi:hypothetical protein
VTDWFENDELFFRQLSTGHEWAEVVAERFRAAGIAARATPMSRRRTLADRHRYRNEIDVLVGPIGAPVEIKSRNLDFSADPATYPYDTAFVDTVGGWDAKDPKPVAIVLVSQKTGAMLVVPTSSQATWTRTHKRDRVRNVRDIWYAVDRALLIPFDELLDRMKLRWDVGAASPRPSKSAT